MSQLKSSEGEVHPFQSLTCEQLMEIKNFSDNEKKSVFSLALMVFDQKRQLAWNISRLEIGYSVLVMFGVGFGGWIWGTKVPEPRCCGVQGLPLIEMALMHLNCYLPN